VISDDISSVENTNYSPTIVYYTKVSVNKKECRGLIGTSYSKTIGNVCLTYHTDHDEIGVIILRAW